MDMVRTKKGRVKFIRTLVRRTRPFMGGYFNYFDVPIPVSRVS